MGDILYKYLPQKRTGFYQQENKPISGFFPNFTLSATMPKSLNDPFECLLSIENLYSNEDLDNYCKRKKEIVTERKKEEEREKKIRISKKELYKQFNVCVKRIKNDEAFKAGKINDRLIQYIDEINKSIRITSFSKNKDSLLMWAHYADEHRGFVVGITPRKERESQLYNVTYGDDLIKLQHDSNGNLNAKEEALTFKSKDWAYENEIRLLSIPSEPNQDNLIHFYTDEISEIILGARMEECEKDKIIKCSKGYSALDKLKIFQAKISKTKYKLEFEEITPTS